MKTEKFKDLPTYMPIKPADKAPHPVGTPVIVVRPHLWSGCVGVVEKIWDNKSQIIRIAGRNGDGFTGLAWPEQLRIWPWGNLMWDDPIRSRL